MLRSKCFLKAAFIQMPLPRLAVRTMSAFARFSPMSSVRGVMLDLDGTLTAPHAIDFDRMRRRIGMPVGQGSVLHWIEAQANDSAERAEQLAVVEEEERLGLERMRLNAGFGELVDALKTMRAPTAIATRNGPEALARFRNLLAEEGFGDSDVLFHVQLARDHFSPALERLISNKPSPEPAHEIVRRWGLKDVPLSSRHEAELPHSPGIVFCGDNFDDCLCGRRAGFSSVFVTNDEQDEKDGYVSRVLGNPDRSKCIDHVVKDLSELAGLLLRAASGNEEEGAGGFKSSVY